MPRKYWALLVIVCCGGIFLATASPASTGDQTKQWITELLPLTDIQARLLNVALRKLVHVVTFAMLAVLFYGLFERRFWPAWLAATIYAATDELHQYFVPNRTGAVLDVMLDAAGALVGLLIARRFASVNNKRVRNTYKG